MRVWRMFSFVLLLIAVLVVGGCASDDAGGEESAESEPATVESDAASEDDAAAAEEVSEEDADADDSTGEVTWSGPEDDRGAAWEIEVTQSDGTETDVLVAADGSIVKQVEKYTGSGDSDGSGDSGDGGSSGEVTLEEAEQIAVEAVGGGNVTWSGEEDERGAKFEIEVTRPNGNEIDVLIDANGNVVS